MLDLATKKEHIKIVAQNGKFYKSRQRNTETGKKDDIPGLWNQPPEKKEKEKK